MAASIAAMVAPVPQRSPRLLRAGLFEEVLHGIKTFEKKDIVAHARSVANVMWKLMQVEVL